LLTPATTYWDLGRKAAEARNQDNEPAALEVSDQFRKFRKDEREDDKEPASVAYHRAYRQYRRI
jgi:hypothetical protein